MPPPISLTNCPELNWTEMVCVYSQFCSPVHWLTDACDSWTSWWSCTCTATDCARCRRRWAAWCHYRLWPSARTPSPPCPTRWPRSPSCMSLTFGIISCRRWGALLATTQMTVLSIWKVAGMSLKSDNVFLCYKGVLGDVILVMPVQAHAWRAF